MSSKVKYALAMAVAAIVPGVSAPAAMATPNEAADCLYQGTATITAPGVGWSANTGKYGYDSWVFDCAGTDVNDTSETAVTTISLSSGGSFANSVCGTGTADGTATVTDDGNNPEFQGATTSYHLQFVAGEGILSATGKDADGTFTFLGSTSIIATGYGNTPNSTYCTESFQVVGDLEFGEVDTTPGT